MNKSSRHSKIAGDFGELVMLYWLSKRGFECARVDHVGIDLIARRPQSDEVLGITVKTRSRTEQRRDASAQIVSRSDEAKVRGACAAYHCVPYAGIVIDQGSHVRGYLISLERLHEISPAGRWSMTPSRVAVLEAADRLERFVLRGDGDWIASGETPSRATS